MNKNRHTLRKRMILVNILLSVIPILLLCVVTMVVYIYSVRHFVRNSADLLSDQSVKRAEDCFDNVNRMSGSIFYDTNIIESILKITDEKEYFKQYNKIAKEFDRYVGMNEMLQGIAFFSKKTGYKFLSSNIERKDVIFDESLMTNRRQLYIKKGDNAFYCIFKIRSVLNDSYHEEIGTGVLIVDSRRFYDIVRGDQNNSEATIVVHDCLDNLIARTQGRFSEDIAKYFTGDDTEHNGRIKVENHSFCTAEQPIEMSGWRIGVAVDMMSKDNNTRAFMTALFVTMLVVLLVSVLSVLLFSYSYTKPIKNLIGAFEGLKTGNFKSTISTEDEGSLDVYDSFNSMVHGVRQLMARMLRTQEGLYEAELKRQQADLRALRSQINSHFLYNTLNCIKGMSLSNDSHNMQVCIDNMICFLRYAVGDDINVTFGQEVEYLGIYMNIQRMRHGRNLRYYCSCDERVKECQTLRLILQPFVENCLNHGLRVKGYSGLVGVKITLDEPYVTVKIFDNGAGISKEAAEAINSENFFAPDSKGEHMGISNTVLRLKNFYRGNCSVKVKALNGRGTVFLIRVPSGRAPEFI